MASSGLDERQAMLARAHLDSLNPPVTLARRGFLAGSAAAGFAAAVAPTGDLLAQVINTPADGLRSGDLLIATRDGRQLPAYFAAPAARSSAPVILVVQEIFGVHEHIRDVCRRFAREGWYAVAPELFFREGDPAKAESAAQILQTIVPRVTDAQVMADLDATLAHAKANGADVVRAGITGFCWGGRITWLYAAHNPAIKAGVAWYGRLTGPVNAANPAHPQDVAGSLHAPVLGLYGGTDAGIPLASVDDMKARLAAGNDNARRSTIVVYPDAPHAFHADYRPSYRKEAAVDGWQRAIEWFRRFGVA